MPQEPNPFLGNRLPPRRTSQIVVEGSRLYRARFLRLFAIAALGEALLSSSAFVLVGLGLSGLRHDLAELASDVTPQQMSDVVQEHIASLLIFGGMAILVTMIVVALRYGALLYAISQELLGQRIRVVSAYEFALRRTNALLVSTLLVSAVTVFVMIPMFLFGLPFLLIFVAAYFLTRWGFVWPVVLMEGLGPMAALSRSSELVRGNWWRVSGMVVSLLFMGFVFAALLGRVMPLGTSIGSALMIPFVTTAHTLLYYDLRVRKEDYTPETMATELAR